MLSLCQDPCNAGTDTSTGSMQWAIAKFINYPDAFKVREAIDLVVGGTRLVNESVVKMNFVYWFEWWVST